MSDPVRLHVRTAGAGPPVVMLHGLMVGSLAQWYFTVAPHLTHRHRVVMYDLRGHGRSERAPTGYGVDTLCDDLEGVVRSQELEAPLDLVGHSYGGLIALRYAARHPGQVRRLVLVDTPLPPADEGLFDVPEDGDPDDLLQLLPAPLQADVRRGGRRARRLFDGLEFLALQSTLFDDVRAEPPLQPAELEAITCPTLCLYGTRSACLPHGRELASHLPHARLTTLDSGHFVPVEAPGALAAHLAEFLDG